MCVRVHVMCLHEMLIRKRALSSNKEKHIHTRVKLPVEMFFVRQCDESDGDGDNDDDDNDAGDDGGRGDDVDGDLAQDYTESLIIRCNMMSPRETHAITIRLMNGHDLEF